MKSFKSIALAVFAAVTVVGYAVQPLPVAAEGSAALSVEPKKNYMIEPGKSISDTVTVRNIDADQTLYLTLNTVDFTYMDDTGAPKFNKAEDAQPTAWSLKPFLTAPKKVTIDPNSSKTIDINIEIPTDIGGGSYYSAIEYATSTSEGGNVAMNASLTTLVFVSVPGDVDERLTLEKLGAYDNRVRKYRYFNTEVPKRIAYTLRNEGNVAQSPVGSITLKSLFGQEITISDVNPNGSLALREQTRTFESCIKLTKDKVDFNGTRAEATTCADSGLFPGYYSVSLNLFYGQNGNNTQEVSGTAGFWYMPWWALAILGALLAIVAYFVWKIVRKFRGDRPKAPKSSQKSRR